MFWKRFPKHMPKTEAWYQCTMEEDELIATITKDPVHGITSTSDADVMEREVKSLSASLHGNIVVVI